MVRLTLMDGGPFLITHAAQTRTSGINDGRGMPWSICVLKISRRVPGGLGRRDGAGDGFTHTGRRMVIMV